jgi:hypothetical protein
LSKRGINRQQKKPSPHSGAGSRASWDWIFALVLVIVTFLVYQPAWRGEPILDDTVHVTNTQELRSVSGLIHLWTDPPTTRQYHPLLDTFYWIEDKLWGESLLGYHLVNILLHLFSVFLLLKILRRLEIPGAWLAAAIFALHPVQVESVAWVAELKNTLSGVFFFGSLLVYLQFERNRSRLCYTLVLLLFVLGLLVKTIVAILPAAILILVWWKRGKLHWKHDVRPLIPLMFLGIAAGIFTAWMEREFVGARGEEFDFSLIERFLIAGRAFWLHRQAHLAGETRVDLSAMECGSVGLVAVFVSGGGSRAVRVPVDSWTAAAMAVGRSTFLCPRHLSAARSFQRRFLPPLVCR